MFFTDSSSKENGAAAITDEMRLTLAYGLHYRFKDIPYEFEEFAAGVMENCLGGNATTTQRSGDFGVDILHDRGRHGLYLGQVKCKAPGENVDYEPISIIHSQIMKQRAKGGYVITTSNFTTGAQQYANEIKRENQIEIHLINGYELVRYWLGEKENWFASENTGGLFTWLLKEVTGWPKY
ncbi:restriction endonuclease [Effusibacillus consociatus]|uniref:Restriction endonuclease n=1 Tax=Effusibacillus consociatus TaxID=1117041 RepID=A0ABV9Q550_9BACL